jgi:hypothetical protein
MDCEFPVRARFAGWVAMTSAGVGAVLLMAGGPWAALLLTLLDGRDLTDLALGIAVEENI